MAGKESNQFLTPQQIAETLNVHPRTVTRMIKSGEIPGVKFGRQYRVSVPAFSEFMTKASTARNPQPDDILVVKIDEKNQDDS